MHDDSLAAVVWQRLKRVQGLLPFHVKDSDSEDMWMALRVNPRFRFCRYHPGQVSAIVSPHCCALSSFITKCTQHYRRHLDLGNVLSDKLVTSHTVNIYLNGDFEAGRTRFYLDPLRPNDPTFHVKPATGTIKTMPHFHTFIRVNPPMLLSRAAWIKPNRIF